MSRLAPPHAAPAGVVLADRLVTAIALGEFVPDQRLPAEREFADMLGVSRTTVRDALARVASLGLIEIRRGRSGGAFVRSGWAAESAGAVRQVVEPQWAALEEAMDMRDLVEGLVARTAAARRTPGDIREIAAALRDYECAPDLAAAQAADLRLHSAVAAAAHNARLVQLHERLLSEVSLGFAVEPFTQPIYDLALDQHRALAAAVVAGEEEAAWAVGREHFSITSDQLRQTRARATEEPP
ncbi:MAG: GntR family transcriptional regulator [Frankiales bacterium]|nr:GntR family transcriptional regulator [Frankiales bacterium]